MSGNSSGKKMNFTIEDFIFEKIDIANLNITNFGLNRNK